jgi:hypothetical protein
MVDLVTKTTRIILENYLEILAVLLFHFQQNITHKHNLVLQDLFHGVHCSLDLLMSWGRDHISSICVPFPPILPTCSEQSTSIAFSLKLTNFIDKTRNESYIFKVCLWVKCPPRI